MAAAADAPLYLGIDLSTQGLKVVALQHSSGASGRGDRASSGRARLEAVFDAAANFDADLPHYGTAGGAHRDAATGAATSPALMFVEAVDLVLSRMQQRGFPFSRVRALSVSGQQHGSVYWNAGAEQRLATLDAGSTLLAQLRDCFAVEHCPIWADASTPTQCRALERAFASVLSGDDEAVAAEARGARALAEHTGSRAYERFTGVQLVKLAQTRPEALRATARVQLISAFVASLFAGAFCAEDVAEASGTNLFELRSEPPRWSDEGIAAAERAGALRPGTLRARLSAAPRHSCTVAASSVHSYFAQRYGFPSPPPPPSPLSSTSAADADAAAAVVTASGDNPNSAAGLGMRLGDLAVSLGTSDTAFGRTFRAAPQPEAHVFRSALDRLAYMPILVYANGSLTREWVRDRCARGSWREFESMLARTPPGNDGVLGFVYKVHEILPRVHADTVQYVRVADDDNGGGGGEEVVEECASALSPAAMVRAVVEQRALAIRVHGERLGLAIPPRRVIVTGGASRSPGIRRVLADVLGAPVYASDDPNSAARGAALRAAHAVLCSASERRRRSGGSGEDDHHVDGGGGGGDFDAWAPEADLQCVAEPDAAAHALYTKRARKFASIEARYRRRDEAAG